MSKDKEDDVPESIEEAGILEADVGANFVADWQHQLRAATLWARREGGGGGEGEDALLSSEFEDLQETSEDNTTASRSSRRESATLRAHDDRQLSGIDPKLQIIMDPQAHRDLRPEMMFIREELRQAKMQTLAVRRTALKKLLLKDFLEEDCELKNIGLSYAPPDP